MKKINKSPEQWEKNLGPQLYKITRERGTEAPFSKTLELSEDGIYRCSVCSQELFSTKSKFERGTG